MNQSQTRAVYALLRAANTSVSMDTEDYEPVQASYDAGRKAVTFTISTFMDDVVERDQNVFRDYLISLDSAPVEHIIFDITGNSGGNTDYWENNIVRLFDGTYTWETYWYLRETDLTREFFFDHPSPDQDSLDLSTLVPYPISELPAEHELPAFAEELGVTHYMKVQNTISGEGTLPAEYLSAKRWVLINENVYSAAESFAHFCKETGWATLVGQTTRGDGAGRDPVMFPLPNTGILVRFSALAVENSAGQLDAVAGTASDIPVNVLESIQGACNRLIDEENQ